MTSHDKYIGMTVNERLFAAGLLEAFEDAVSTRNRSEMTRILNEVKIDNPSKAADSILCRRPLRKKDNGR